MLSFLERLCSWFEIALDGEMAQVLTERASAELMKLRVPAEPTEMDSSNVTSAVERIQAAFDRRFMELATMLSHGTGGREPPPIRPEYSVPVAIELGDLSDVERVVIGADTSLQTVLDNLYFAMEPKVPAYSYLRHWVLVRCDENELVPLIVRHIQSKLTASSIMEPGSTWRALRLKVPYQAGQFLDTTGGRIQDR